MIPGGPGYDSTIQTFKNVRLKNSPASFGKYWHTFAL
jgi:hypothetical protein